MWPRKRSTAVIEKRTKLSDLMEASEQAQRLYAVREVVTFAETKFTSDVSEGIGRTLAL